MIWFLAHPFTLPEQERHLQRGGEKGWERSRITRPLVPFLVIQSESDLTRYHPWWFSALNIPNLDATSKTHAHRSATETATEVSWIINPFFNVFFYFQASDLGYLVSSIVPTQILHLAECWLWLPVLASVWGELNKLSRLCYAALVV
jgi:hypothetical protein